MRVHLAPLIQDLAVILFIAGLMALFCRRIRQPVVLGYLLAGIVLGPHTPPFSWVTDLKSIQVWAELGVIFLMFSLGLEFTHEQTYALAQLSICGHLTSLYRPKHLFQNCRCFVRMVGLRYKKIESFLRAELRSSS